MNALTQFESHLPPEISRVIGQIKSPFDVQEFLLSMPYNAEARDRSPLNALLDKQCHCLDGGFLAALLLWKLDFKPLVIDLVPLPKSDDDHVLAIYRINERWGAVAKSNFVHLGFREAVYANVRELVMSYFEHYFNLDSVRTLRGYTRPFDLSRYPDPSWPYDEPAANRLYKRFYAHKPIQLITPAMAKRLNLVRERNFKADTLGADMKWVYGNRKE
jgi:hypothetical protein